MVSVVMPTYNREKVIARAIQSVLNQTFKDLELIIVDDGSTDDTRLVVNQIRDERVRYFYQNNAGACRARNLGIEKANGEYIAFHDSDDIWHLDKLEKQMRVFENTPNVDVVFCKLLQYQDNKPALAIPEHCGEGIMEPVTNLFGIGTQTIVGKRKVFQEFKFDEKMPRFQEFELLLRIVNKYKLYCLSEGLVDYFIGSDSISGNPEKLLKASELLLEKHNGFTRQYPIMADLLAARLQIEAKRKVKNQEQYMPYLKQAHKISPNAKILLKLACGYLGLYPRIFVK